MAKPIRSFTERQAEASRREALETLTCTERLLVQILLQLMAMQASRNTEEIAERLRGVGFSTKQIAALLETTPATLAVLKRRADVDGGSV